MCCIYVANFGIQVDAKFKDLKMQCRGILFESIKLLILMTWTVTE